MNLRADTAERVPHDARRDGAEVTGPSGVPGKGGGAGGPALSLFALWRRLAGWFVFTPWVVWTLVAINLFSAVLGYVYWYGADILASPVYLWPLVPDSPLSATLWALALLSVYYRRRVPVLGLLAVTGSIKYGLWTDWVWFTNALSGGSYDLEAVVLSLNHFGMVLEGLALLPFIRFSLWEVAVVAGWYGLNDLSDYGLGHRPRIPNPGDQDVIAAFAVASTAALSALWLALARLRRPARPVPPS